MNRTLDSKELEPTLNTHDAFSLLRPQNTVVNIQDYRQSDLPNSSTTDLLHKPSAVDDETVPPSFLGRKRPYRIHLCRMVQDAHSAGEHLLLVTLWRIGTPDPPTAKDPYSKRVTIGWKRMGALVNMSDKAAKRNLSCLIDKLAVELIGPEDSTTRTGRTYLFAAVVIFVAHSAITVHFMLAMIESYLVIGAGYIFLGFGGSRWTTPYAEKYVSQVVSVGARLMVFYLIIGLGQQFATQWIADSQVAATGASANLSLSWTLAAQVAMYAVICWTLPKLVSNVIGFTLSASGGDAIAMGVAAGTAAVSGVAMLSGLGAPAAAAGGASAVSSVASAAGAANAAAGSASVGAASTAAGAGTLSAGAGGASNLGGSSLASARAASGYTGPGGGESGAFASQTGNAVQPAPPSNLAKQSLSSAAAPHVTAGQSVVQPPPPARELAAARAANKANDLIKNVHSSLPHDGAVASGPGLNIGHSVD